MDWCFLVAQASVINEFFPGYVNSGHWVWRGTQRENTCSYRRERFIEWFICRSLKIRLVKTPRLRRQPNLALVGDHPLLDQTFNAKQLNLPCPSRCPLVQQSRLLTGLGGAQLPPACGSWQSLWVGSCRAGEDTATQLPCHCQGGEQGQPRDAGSCSQGAAGSRYPLWGCLTFLWKWQLNTTPTDASWCPAGSRGAQADTPTPSCLFPQGGKLMHRLQGGNAASHCSSYLPNDLDIA